MHSLVNFKIKVIENDFLIIVSHDGIISHGFSSFKNFFKFIIEIRKTEFIHFHLSTFFDKYFIIFTIATDKLGRDPSIPFHYYSLIQITHLNQPVLFILLANYVDLLTVMADSSYPIISLAL